MVRVTTISHFEVISAKGVRFLQKCFPGNIKHCRTMVGIVRTVGIGAVGYGAGMAECSDTGVT